MSSRVKKKTCIKWIVPCNESLRDIPQRQNEVVIVCYQESEGYKYASKLMESYSERNIYYISELMKNELDEIIMKEYPDDYEKEVLVGRKIDLDHNLDVKFKDIISELEANEEFPLFNSIEIETINCCNGLCEFCPVNRNDDPRTLKKMSKDLFEKIIDELAGLSYNGRLNLFSNNEPLMDNRIVEFAKYAKENVPLANVVLFTNGTLLKMDKFLELIKYLDLLCIDFYYDNDERLELNDNLKNCLEYVLANEELQKKVYVSFICRKAIRNNRGGQSKNRTVKYRVQARCILPYIQMIIRPDGKVSLCCNDPIGKNTLGDVSESSLIDVWNNNAFANVRRAVRDTRQNYEFCQECDNFATLNRGGNGVFTSVQMR
jgi:radical SAM protein with 4Fe4S-binding SPASM domain